jgi:serine O-acetyltransferase
MASSESREFWRALRRRHPHLREALVADAAVTARFRGERHEFRSGADAALQAVRLAWQSDAYAALALYRAKARLQALGVPFLPRVAHRLAMASAQICIGDPVIMEPGVYFPHGQVVIDGITVIEGAVAVRPWVTIGLKEGDFHGPVIERNVQIGTGAKIVGPVRLGRGALIGANAVVVADVPAGATAVGVPARVLDRSPGGNGR